jgi:hypothetical protein
MQDSINGAQPLGFDNSEVLGISNEIQANQEELQSKPNVVGVGYGRKVIEHEGGRDTSEPALKVLVRQNTTAAHIVMISVPAFGSGTA